MCFLVLSLFFEANDCTLTLLPRPQLPFQLVLRIWDALFFQGESVLAAMSLVVLKMNTSEWDHQSWLKYQLELILYQCTVRSHTFYPPYYTHIFQSLTRRKLILYTMCILYNQTTPPHTHIHTHTHMTGQFLREREDGIRISLQELSRQSFNEDEVIAELQSVTADLSKSRQAIPQVVELVELSELNRQALERAALNSASSPLELMIA